MTLGSFDVATHHRTRTRRAEARADHLERERGKLERLLVVALDVAVGRTGVDRIELLKLLEEMLEQVDEIRRLPEPSTDDLVQLLRATDPDGDWREAR